MTRPPRLPGLWGAGLALVLASRPCPADAQQLVPVTDRDYTLDLHQGAVLGSSRVVAMGGAAIAQAEGSAGAIANAAGAAVRPAGANDKWDWDWHVDWLNSAVGTDFDNNGVDTTDSLGSFMLTFGVLGRYRQWAVAAVVTQTDRTVDRLDPMGQADGLVIPTAKLGRVIVARTFAADAFTVGLGTRVASLSIATAPEANPNRSTELFRLTGSSIDAGLIWRPPGRRMRAGISVSAPVLGENVEATECDPMNCEGFILPLRVAVPWELSLGVAYRHAASAWNRRVRTEWLDERAVLLAADLVLTGAVSDGHGVEAFAQHALQESGRSVGVSPRLGAEYEWLPGRLRVRGGTYFEPGRFEGVPGRAHATFGLEYRFWDFRLWGKAYRVRASVTADVARGYGNGGISVGFWH